MPFAGYADFDECVAKNKGKVGDAEAYCASIKKKVEGNSKLGAHINTVEETGMITLASTPEKVEMRNGILEIEGTLLAPGNWNGLEYTEDRLMKTQLPSMDSKPVKLSKNHGKRMEDDIGIFTEMAVKEGGRIHYRAYVDDPESIRYINRRRETLQKLGLKEENAFEISSELYGKRIFDEGLKKNAIDGIKIKRASLVMDGACSPPNCTVTPNKMLSDNEQTIDNATKCESQYMDKGRTRFQKGWEGCIEAVRACRGLGKKEANNMCNFIFWGRHAIRDFDIICVLDAYGASDDKDAFIEKCNRLMFEWFKNKAEKEDIDMGDDEKIFDDFAKLLGVEKVVKNEDEKKDEKEKDNGEVPPQFKKKGDKDKKDDEEDEEKKKDNSKTESKTESKEETNDDKSDTTELAKLNEELNDYKRELAADLAKCECVGLSEEELMAWSLPHLKALSDMQKSFLKKNRENKATRRGTFTTNTKTEDKELSQDEKDAELFNGLIFGDE